MQGILCLSHIVGLYKVLSQLTVAGDVTKEQFRGSHAYLVAHLANQIIGDQSYLFTFYTFIPHLFECQYL